MKDHQHKKKKQARIASDVENSQRRPVKRESNAVLTSCRPWALTRTAHSISGMQRRRNAQTANAPVRIIWRFYRTERPPRHVLQKLADSRLRVKKLNTKTLQLWSLMKPLFTVQILFSLIMTSICSAFRIFLTRTIWGVLLRFSGGDFIRKVCFVHVLCSSVIIQRLVYDLHMPQYYNSSTCKRSNGYRLDFRCRSSDFSIRRLA